MTDYERGRQDERAAVVAWLTWQRDMWDRHADRKKPRDETAGTYAAAMEFAMEGVKGRRHIAPNVTNLAPETTEDR